MSNADKNAIAIIAIACGLSFVFYAYYLVSREERCHGDLSGVSRLAAAVNATRIEDNKRASHSSRRLKL